MNERFEFHPAANLLRLMSDEEFNALKRDMYEHGQRDPIIIHDGKILDGRNRYRACLDMEIEPSLLKLDRHDVGNDPIAYVISVNARRRHLTPSDLALSVEEAEKLYLEDARQMQQKAGGDKSSAEAKALAALVPQALGKRNLTAREKAAKALGISRRTGDQGVNVTKNGAAELIDAVKSGAVNVKTADQLVRAVPAKEEQASIVAGAVAVPDPNKSLRNEIAARMPLAPQEKSLADEPPPQLTLVISRSGRRKLTAAIDKVVGLMEGEGIADHFRSCLTQMAEAVVNSFEATGPSAGNEKFEAWWDVYPKKVGKDAALRAYLAAIKRLKVTKAAPHAFIHERVTAFAASPKAKGSFCPNPATWLNEGRYDDDPQTWSDSGNYGAKTHGRRTEIGPGQRNTTGDASRAGVGKW